MKWQNHIIIGSALGAVIDPVLVPIAALGSTAPDWLEWVLKSVGIRVKHRTVTHVVFYWIAAIAFFALIWDWRHIGLGFTIGGFSHVFADSFTIAGVPFAPWSSERFHLFGGKLKTGNTGEYLVASLFALMCFGLANYTPMSIKSDDSKSSFIPFFYDWKGHYDDGLIDGREWKDNRLKFF
jgi:inner membrane protein